MPNPTRCTVALFCEYFLELGGTESAYNVDALLGEVLESNGMHMSVLANTYVCAGAVAVLQMHELLPSPSPSPSLTPSHLGPYPHPLLSPLRSPIHLLPTHILSFTLVLTRCS